MKAVEVKVWRQEVASAHYLSARLKASQKLD